VSQSEENAARDLERLSELAGIEPSYQDYFGRTFLVSQATKRAVLSALGFAIGSAAEIETSLTMLEEAPWRRMLEPVIVATRSARRPLRVPITLPQSDSARLLRWEIACEDGHARQGEVRFDALRFAGTRSCRDGVMVRRILEIAAGSPAGYHRISVDGARGALIVAPPQCYLPRALSRGAKLWGIAVQLYGLRSRRNWGIGDFEDLRELGRAADRAGAAAVGLNPLHELDPADPEAFSPYSPSSRLFLNVAYLDVEGIPDFAESDEARELTGSSPFVRALAAAREAPLVDYRAVAACKRPVLELLYASFRQAHLALDTERGRAFREFVARSGEALELLVVFEALRECFAAERPHENGWTSWPLEFRDPASPAVARFAHQHRERVEFFAYLQWNADVQLTRAARACGRMPIGLYRDLAVGAGGAGAETWSDQRAFLPGLGIGAPPDALNVLGQDWGLSPPSPLALREGAYARFARLLRANKRHSGALRIDHVMALQRLFVIPHGEPPGAGAYLRYPFEDLLAIVALESERNRCLVVGEDLGTVPAGFRERLQRARVLSCRLLYFEREADGAYRSPEAYPALALASPGTHDLPTLTAFWTGSDLDVRAQLGLLPTGGSVDEAKAGRALEKSRLLDALVAGGDLDPGAAELLRGADRSTEPLPIGLAVRAAYRYLARSGARLVIGTLEDAFDVVEQINVPGTTWQHPNWRRRLPIAVEELADDPRFAAFSTVLRAFRARPGRHSARSSPERR
jgi:4-alpha-glucanotransferase